MPRNTRSAPSLIYAIIKTESNFNPFAVGSAPAYGLMQLVPTSGGREAFRVAKGEDGIPSKQYLFEPGNNIELGVAYLNVLTFKQLERVENPIAREYCVISAYNTGPSNVLRAFSRNKDDAVNVINGLQPPEIYQRLRTNLPYDETRRYLHKGRDRAPGIPELQLEVTSEIISFDPAACGALKSGPHPR